MHDLSAWIQSYIEKSMERKVNWRELQVTFSDSSIPGEGEHKIMDFIRYQKAQESYNIHTRHCLYGIDSDLLLLGLATHEPNFTILREDSEAKSQGKVVVVHRLMKDLFNEETLQKSFSIFGKVVKVLVKEGESYSTAYIWFEDTLSARNCETSLIRVNGEFILPVKCVKTTAIFSQETNEVVERLCVSKLNGDTSDASIIEQFQQYKPKSIRRVLTYDKVFNGVVFIEFESTENLYNCYETFKDQMVISITKKASLGKADDLINKFLTLTNTYSVNLAEDYLEYFNWDLDEALKRFNDGVILTTPTVPENKTYTFVHIYILREYFYHEFKALGNDQDEKKRDFDLVRIVDDFVLITMLVGNDFLPHLPAYDGRRLELLLNMYKDFYDQVGVFLTEKRRINFQHLKLFFEYLSKHESMKLLAKFNERTETFERKSSGEQIQLISTSDDLPYRIQYYKKYFPSTPCDSYAIDDICKHFLRGLVWMYKYYYEGIPSWEWFYPFYFSPLTEDLANFLSRNKCDDIFSFELGEPLRPLRHLMAVLPVENKHLVPQAYRSLMEDDNSPIKYFYPVEFDIMNETGGPSWAAIPILPFIDVALLKNTLDQYEDQLTEEEKQRNKPGYNRLYANSLITSVGIQFSSLALNPQITASCNIYYVSWTNESLSFRPLTELTCSKILTGQELKKLCKRKKRHVKKPMEHNVMNLVDIEGSECLNVKPNCKFNDIFEQNNTHRLESDLDDQLLFNLKFKSPIALKEVVLRSPMQNGPRNLKFFVNRESLSFENTEDTTCTQEFTLSKSDQDDVEVIIKLAPQKFSKTYSLSILVENNQNDSESTSISEMRFVGVPERTADAKGLISKK